MGTLKEHEDTDLKQITAQSFEESLQELDAIVKRMSGGDQSLEKSLQEFERGVKLVRDCQQALKNAELRVERLTQLNENSKTESVNSDSTVK